MHVVIKYIVLLSLLILGIHVNAQNKKIYVEAKPLSNGKFISRIITLDSIESVRIEESRIFYQKFQNKKLIQEKELIPGTRESLQRLADGTGNYYLNEMNDIYNDTEDPIADIKEIKSVLLLLSYFTLEGTQWLGVGTEDRITDNKPIQISYYLLRPNGKKLQLNTVDIDQNFWNIKYPIPPAPQIQCSDHAVTLELHAEATKGKYFGYLIERSPADRNEWLPTREHILINSFQDFEDARIRNYYKTTDSFPENNTLLAFRVRGMDYFGQFGPPGDSAICTGFEAIKANLYINDREMVSDSAAKVYWSFDSEELDKVKSFDLMYNTDSIKGNYSLLLAGLDYKSQSIELKIPNPVGYYMIRAVPHYGQPIYSVPFFLERFDHIPPATPQGAKGFVDKKGHVTLSWLPNKEPDLWGYRIYFANNKTDEFSLISDKVLNTTILRDTLDLNNLSPNIYYKLLAIDKRGNSSPFTDIIEITKPDTIPPTAPLIKELKQYKNKEIALLKIAGSSSIDVTTHEVFRSDSSASKYVSILKVGPILSDTIIVDTGLVNDKTYFYKVKAIDNSKNETFSDERSLELIFDGIRKSLTGVLGILDTTHHTAIIRWPYPSHSPLKVQIYKSIGNGIITMKALVPIVQGEYVDNETSVKDNAIYKVRTLYPDGTYSDLITVRMEIKQKKNEQSD